MPRWLFFEGDFLIITAVAFLFCYFFKYPDAKSTDRRILASLFHSLWYTFVAFIFYCLFWAALTLFLCYVAFAGTKGMHSPPTTRREVNYHQPYYGF